MRKLIISIYIIAGVVLYAKGNKVNIYNRDIIIEKSRDGFDIYVRAKRGIGCIAAVKRVLGKNPGIFILRNTSGDWGGIVRYRDKLLGPDDGLYYIVSASKTNIEALGDYFYMKLPYYVEYGYRELGIYGKFKVENAKTQIGIWAYPKYPPSVNKHIARTWITIDTNKFISPLKKPPHLIVRSLRRIDDKWTIAVLEVEARQKYIKGLYYNDEGTKLKEESEFSPKKIEIEYSYEESKKDKKGLLIFERWNVKEGIRYRAKVFFRHDNTKHYYLIYATTKEGIDSNGVLIEISKPKVIDENITISHPEETNNSDTQAEDIDTIESNEEDNTNNQYQQKEQIKGMDNTNAEEIKEDIKQDESEKLMEVGETEEDTEGNVQEDNTETENNNFNTQDASKNVDNTINNNEVNELAETEKPSNNKHATTTTTIEIRFRDIAISPVIPSDSSDSRLIEVRKYLKEATHYVMKQDYNKAISYYKRCASIYSSLNDRENTSIYMALIAYYLEKSGEMDGATEYYDYALEYANTLDRLIVGAIYNNKGNIYTKREEWEIAEENYIKALNIFEEEGDAGYKATAMFNMAMMYLKQKKTDRAIEYLENCIRLEREIKFIYYKEDEKLLDKIKSGGQ